MKLKCIHNNDKEKLLQLYKDIIKQSKNDCFFTFCSKILIKFLLTFKKKIAKIFFLKYNPQMFKILGFLK